MNRDSGRIARGGRTTFTKRPPPFIPWSTTLRDAGGEYLNMHIYHYNHTERSALLRMTESHGVAEAELAALVTTGAFVDLYTVALNGFQVGVESYGLKCLERLTSFER